MLQVLHPELTLAVCFLGCWVMREAVTPMDIVQWASDGTLPYLRLPSLATQLLENARDAGCDLPLSLLRLKGTIQWMCFTGTCTLRQLQEHRQA